MSEKINPRDLYDLICQLSRPYSGHPDKWQELYSIAHGLYHLEPKELGTILIGGWHLYEEGHGIPERESGTREVLGQGALLYRGMFIEKELKEHKWTSEIAVEAWRQEKRVVFLALRTVTEYGYAGIDNHYGTDTTWEVAALRIVDFG